MFIVPIYRKSKSSKDRKYSMEDTEPILNETIQSKKNKKKSRSKNEPDENTNVTVDDFFQ